MPTPEPHRPFRRRVLLNTVSTGVANGWAIVVSLVSLPLLLHGLGAAQFGTWALLLTFSAVNGWFSLLDLGLGTAATREIATRRATDDHAGLGSALGSTLVVLGVVAVASAVLIVVAGRPLLPHLFRTPDRLVPALQVAIVAFAGQVAFDLVGGACQASLEGLQRVDLSRGADMARRTLVAIATAVAALVTRDLENVAFAALAAAAVGAVVAGGMLWSQTRGIRYGVRRDTVVELFRYGKTVAVLRPIGVLHRTMDRFIVGAVLGPAAVSLVEIATQVQNGADAVLSASSYAVVPSASWLHARGDRHKLADLVETGTRYVLLATLPVAALGAVLAGPAIRLWVGARYQDAAGLAVIALATVAVVAPVQVGSNLLLGIGRASAILRAAGLAIVVNLGLSLVLVHVTGIVGPFQATLVSTAVTVPLLGAATLREVELGAGHFVRHAVAPTLLPVALAAAAAGVVVLAPLGDFVTLVVGGLLGVGVYALTAPRLGMQRGEARELIAAVAGRR